MYGIVSLLDCKRDALTDDDRLYPRLPTTPGSDVHMIIEPRTGDRKTSKRGKAKDHFNVMTLMSKKQSFGYVSIGPPLLLHLDQLKGAACMHRPSVREYYVTSIFSDNGTPHDKYHGRLQIWRPDTLVNLLSFKDKAGKGHDMKPPHVDAMNELRSIPFLSELQHVYKSQGNEHGVKENEKQSVYEEVDISSLIEILSLLLTDLNRREHFPPSPKARHVWFIFPKTTPVAFYPQSYMMQNSLMRLYSFLYSKNDNYLSPILARAGFYHLGDENSTVSCPECSCLCSIAVFKEMRSSEIDRLHDLECSHRHYREEDCALSPPRRRICPNSPEGSSKYEVGQFERKSDIAKYKLGIVSVCPEESSNTNNATHSNANQAISGVSLDGRPSSSSNNLQLNSLQPCNQNSIARTSPDTRMTNDHLHRNNELTNEQRRRRDIHEGQTTSGSTPSNMVQINNDQSNVEIYPLEFNCNTVMHERYWTAVPSEEPHRSLRYPVWSVYESAQKRHASFSSSPYQQPFIRKLVESGFFYHGKHCIAILLNPVTATTQPNPTQPNPTQTLNINQCFCEANSALPSF